jgi:hypothetical protein
MEDKEVLEPESKEPLFDAWEFFGLTEEDNAEAVGKKIEAKIGIAISVMQEALSKATMERAEELTLEIPNIAPLGDYEKLIEDNDGMAQFLKMEGHKPEHWKLYGIKGSDLQKELISFVFTNLGVDQGDTLKGFVFVTKTGKIKHAFPQYEN